MIGLFHACCSGILSTASHIGTRSPPYKYFLPSWNTSFQHLGSRTLSLELLLIGSQLRCYSIKKSAGSSSQKQKPFKRLMKEDKEAFFVVRKGDLVGVYKSLSDCQAQVGNSICDPPVSVYKGCSMPKDTEKYLMSCGLKNALYTIRASDVTEDLFGTLTSCPLQPSSSRVETCTEPITKKRSHEALRSDRGASEDGVGPVMATNNAKHFKLDPHRVDQNQAVCRSCTLEFDGASKGNPGQAGAGAVLRSDDGSLIYRLREGLGIATNNVAEYRAFILGMKCALSKGFTSVQVRGDSKLVCMQIQGLWKVKNQNISSLYDEARKLKERFQSFQIVHVLRDLNSDADAMANLAVDLAEGQVQEEIDK